MSMEFYPRQLDTVTAYTTGLLADATNLDRLRTALGGGFPRRSAIAGDFIKACGFTVSGSIAPNAGQEQCVPFVIPVGLKIIELRVLVGTPVAGALLRCGFRSDSRGFPDALISDLGTIDASVSGVRSITGLNVISPGGDGLIWLATSAQGNAGATYQQYNGGLQVSDIACEPINFSTIPSRNGVSGALPTNFPRGSMSYQSAPAVYALLASA